MYPNVKMYPNIYFFKVSFRFSLASVVVSVSQALQTTVKCWHVLITFENWCSLACTPSAGLRDWMKALSSARPKLKGFSSSHFAHLMPAVPILTAHLARIPYLKNFHWHELRIRFGTRKEETQRQLAALRITFPIQMRKTKKLCSVSVKFTAVQDAKIAFFLF